MNLMFGGKFHRTEKDSMGSGGRSGGGFGGGGGGGGHHHHHHSSARRGYDTGGSSGGLMMGPGAAPGMRGGQRQQVVRSPLDDHNHYQTHILMGQWKGGYETEQEEDMARYYSSYKKGTSTVIKWGPGRQDSQKRSGGRGDEREVGGGGVSRQTKQVSFSADQQPPEGSVGGGGGGIGGGGGGGSGATSPSGRTKGKPEPASPPGPTLDSPTKKESEKGMTTLTKDCFIIPVASIDRFLPAGVTLPMDKRPSYLNVLEIDDPKLCVFLHVMTPLEAAQPVMESHLAKPFLLQMTVAKQIVDEIHADNKATEGMLLVNMEKNAEYPFINYFIINKGQTDPIAFFDNTKMMVLQKFDPNATRYRGDHLLDLYNEVATIARPPVEPLTKKPLSKTTGYIISVFRVFEGDDSEKLERNWLYWTGARMLYRYLPRSVGLRRITLHKSVAHGDKLYLLMCECTNFLDNISAAAWLVPALRARLCGYTGIYRAVTAF